MIAIQAISLHRTTIPLRIPFRFGIVELTSLEHCVMRAVCRIDAGTCTGYAAENLVPKWFTKNPHTSPEEDVGELRQVVRKIAAMAVGFRGGGPREFWEAFYENATAKLESTPALLRQLGISLVERAVIDAYCRQHDRPFADLVSDGLLGTSMGLPINFKFPALTRSLHVRHTIGLSDSPAELRRIVHSTGIRRFKAKLSGDPAADIERLTELERAIVNASGGDYLLTLDGNESYKLSALAEFLSCLTLDPRLADLREKVRWIEQPLDRTIALTPDAAGLIRQFPMLVFTIDESDDAPDRFLESLACGYRGGTHKNCKGVFKSIDAMAVAAGTPDIARGPVILSGEDLTIVAPWAQTQDLAVAATVNVIDIERNGHHYADGLSAFAPAVGEAALAEHPDLYKRDDRGVVTLRIENGMVRLDSVLAAPFGSRAEPDLTGFDEIAI